MFSFLTTPIPAQICPFLCLMPLISVFLLTVIVLFYTSSSLSSNSSVNSPSQNFPPKYFSEQGKKKKKKPTQATALKPAYFKNFVQVFGFSF